MSRWYQRALSLGVRRWLVEVDVDDAEPPAVAEAPLVVVEQRPDVVAGQRHAGGERVGGRGDVARQVVRRVASSRTRPSGSTVSG